MTSPIRTNASSTAAQARLLSILRDGRVWGREEIADRLAQEAELGVPAPVGTVPEAVDGLIEAGLAHRISKELVAASWRGMRGQASADPGADGTLQVSEGTSGVGVFVDSGDDLFGGAEGLSGRLDPVSARD